ncbi:MAG: hypothetical protein II947_04240 [Bacteroidaceae bacterium]|nr:hypothetical protein [Bacteroidaceae bacterium]
MKRILFYIIACLLFSVNLHAQNIPNGRQHRQEHRQFNPEEFDKWMESYITNEVGLNAEEGKKFFPLLKEMRIKQFKNDQQGREIMGKLNDNSSEADYEEAINRVLELDLQNRKIEKEYYKKFHSVLSWKKIHKVRFAIQKFNMEALRRFTPPQRNRFGGPGQNWRWGQRNN